MTIREALDMANDLEPNLYDDKTKVKWLSQLDNQVYIEILSKHETEVEEFEGYTADTDDSTTLLVPEPYDSIYIDYIKAQIQYQNGEYSKYNNSMAMFNTTYLGYNDYYTRNNMPKSVPAFKY